MNKFLIKMLHCKALRNACNSFSLFSYSLYLIRYINLYWVSGAPLPPPIIFFFVPSSIVSRYTVLKEKLTSALLKNNSSSALQYSFSSTFCFLSSPAPFLAFSIEKRLITKRYQQSNSLGSSISSCFLVNFKSSGRDSCNYGTKM